MLFRAIINDSIRDMVHILSTDNGHQFSSPQRISEDNWVINGCPHTGPAMAENKNGTYFTWFTGGNDAGIYFNSSRDNGKLFTARDTVSGKAAKHCQIAALPDDQLLIVWNESFQTGNNVNSRIGIEVRDANGKTTGKQFITAENGNATFPVIYPVDENKALVAYTENVKKRNYVMFKQVVIGN